MGGGGDYTDMDMDAQRRSNLSRVTGWATGPRTEHYLPSSRLSQCARCDVGVCAWRVQGGGFLNYLEDPAGIPRLVSLYFLRVI